MGKSFRFIGVGLFSALIYFAASVILSALLHADAKLTNVIAYLAGMAVSYVGHRRVTFRSRAAVHMEFVRFAVTNGVNLTLSTLLVYGLVDRLGVNRLLSVVLAALFVMASSFAIMQVWVFRDREARA